MLTTATSCCAAPDKDMITIGSKTCPVTINCPDNSDLAAYTKKWLTEYLADRDIEVAQDANIVWSLETMGDSPDAISQKIDTTFLDHHLDRDAYILSVARDPDKTHINIIGTSVKGMRSGLARLVALATYDSGKLMAAEMCMQKSPFFTERRVVVAPTGRIVDKKSPYRDTLFTEWSDERLEKYAEELWLTGINWVEICELRGYRGEFSDEEIKNEIAPKLITFAKAARKNGLYVQQFIWGQSIFLEGANLCWNDKDEKKQMTGEYDRLAATYGKYVDGIIVHVGDPGGCTRNGCDPYKTTQEITTYLHDQYKKQNPDCRAILSTWANFGFWQGHADAEFLDESYSSKDVGIALHRWYDYDKAKLVIKSKRPLFIWGWYLSDYEMILDTTVLTERLNKYYTNLPEYAGDHVQGLSTEICFHGLPHLINMYVSAQKMWDPYRDLREIEMEFISGTYGDKWAEEIHKVYKACEKYVHPDRYQFFIPETDCLPIVIGTPEYNRELDEAVAAGARVDLSDANTRFVTATPPQKLYDVLYSNLKLISIFSHAQEKIKDMAGSGKDAAEQNAVLDKAIEEAKEYSLDPDYQTLISETKALITEATN